MVWAITLERSDRMNLNRRLIIGSMVLVCVTLVLTSVLTTYLINRQFNVYLTETHKNNLEKIQESVTESLSASDETSFDEVGLFAVSEGYYMEVMDGEGDILYATQNINGPGMMGRQTSILQMRNMHMFSGIDVSSTLIKGADGKEFLLNIGYVQVEGVSEEAASFKNTVYKAVLISLIISLIVGYLLSRKMAKPISEEIRKVSSAAEEIAGGNLNVKVANQASIVEIKELNKAMDVMAETLSEQEMIRRELVETVSHEVKTPLTVLKSQVDAFLDGIYQPDETRLGKCRDEIERLEGLLKRMDDYSSFAEAGYVIDLDTFSVEDELQALSSILAPQFAKKNMGITVDSEDLPDVTQDRYKFRQIMYNLLSNAYKFAHDGSEVAIDVKSDMDAFLVSVKNHGLKIGEEERSAIFKARYRGSDADSMDPHGKGLGLKIVKSLSEAMGGQVWLERSDDEATVFIVRLPMNFTDGED